ncbi:hypothetical protein F4778DRAFT_776773 [Xylariomycetidae sp. FL2044]|nr:hypothetical protein F4778DRAFT_776773 [Xylariomycetidae sp. FL2044]
MGMGKLSYGHMINLPGSTPSDRTPQDKMATDTLSWHGDKPAYKVELVDNELVTDLDELKIDLGKEADFRVENNPFAFSPGQLNKLLNPKSLSAFYAMGGLAGIEKGLRTDRESGLSVDETHLDGTVSFADATSRQTPRAGGRFDHLRESSLSSPTEDPYHVDRLGHSGKSNAYTVVTLPNYLLDIATEPSNDEEPSAMRRPRERSFLPVVVGDKVIDAFPDTNATCNVMTKNFALSHNVPIKRSLGRQRIFTNAVGQQSTSIGEASLRVSFPDEPTKSWLCNFAVAQKCPEGLVFGDHFLRTVTETVTRFRHRLKKSVSSLKKVWRLMHMERPRQKLHCHVDAEPVFANTDTGSDVDIVSLEYARHRDWDITRLPNDEGFVILSDGSLVKITGYVDANLRVAGKAKEKRFYVLKGLVTDVILGDDTLDELDVFNKHAESFVDLDDADAVEDFYMIEWVERLSRIEREVDDILAQNGGQPQVAAAPRNTWSRFASARLRTRDSARAPSNYAITTELRRRLERLDSVEDQLDTEALERMKDLQGAELLREQQDSAARKAKYRQLRTKLLTHLRSSSSST